MGKRKKQGKKQPEKKQHEKKPEKTPGMTLEQKFNILKIACMVLTAIVTCVLLAVFF